MLGELVEMENFRRNSVARYGHEPTAEQIRDVVDSMELRKLAILKSGLVATQH